jgi:tetratricopeptide (TPR) repeat protein
LPIDDTIPDADDTTLHITRELLQAIREGRMPPRALVVLGLEHVRSLCPHCRAELDRDQEDRRRVAYAGPAAFDETFRNLEAVIEEHSAQMDEEAQRADALVAELLALPPARRLERVREDPHHFAKRLVPRQLIDLARRAMPAEPERVFSLAQSAYDICGEVPERWPDRGGMMVEALGLMGNAERLKDRFGEARVLFRLAQSTLWEEGVTDPLVYAELDSFRASLARVLGQLENAARLSSRASLIYAGLAEVELAARCAIQLGCIHYQAGEYQAGIQAFERALRHLDRERDKRLVLSARHSESMCLVELGELVVASQHFEEDQDLYAAFDDAWTQLRRDWLEGRLLEASRPDEAVRLLQRARSGFLAEGGVFDSVLVSLDLGQVFLRAGLIADLEGLAAELSEILRVRGESLAAETLAILRTVLATISSGAATVRLLGETAAMLRRRGDRRSKAGSPN